MFYLEVILYRTIELNRTGSLPQTGNLKPNLKANPRLFTHVKRAQSVNHDMKTRVWGSLSEGSIPVLFISMYITQFSR